MCYPTIISKRAAYQKAEILSQERSSGPKSLPRGSTRAKPPAQADQRRRGDESGH